MIDLRSSLLYSRRQWGTSHLPAEEEAKRTVKRETMYRLIERLVILTTNKPSRSTIAKYKI